MKTQRTILVVEDEESIRNLVTLILEASGYRVLSAGNSEDAFLTSENHEGRIHLLLTDIVMDPNMNGIQLAHHLCILRPDMEVLYMSGYPKNVNLRADLEVSTEVFLAKPFSRDTLMEKVRRLLNDTEAQIPTPVPIAA